MKDWLIAFVAAIALVWLIIWFVYIFMSLWRLP